MNRFSFVFIILLACTPLAEQSEETLRGVGLSPKSFQPDDFANFYHHAKKLDVVMWAGDWIDLENEQSAPHVIMELSKQYGYIPVVAVQFFHQRTGQVIRPLDNETLERYKEDAKLFAAKYEPAYLGLGIELNELKSEQDLRTFVQLFSETYDAIKSVSPDTQIFTSFQLERMRGGGGMFGSTNSPQWNMISLFDKADLIGFTTYPGLVFQSPSDLSPTYYNDILLNVDKPILFSEVAWSVTSVGQWISGEDEQAAFARRFFDLAMPTKPRMVIWTHMYDQAYAEPFNGLGLRERDGSERLAWNEWVSYEP